VFFLTADAFGVLPPIARLDPDEAIYYFLSGYTSKVAGTERGLGQQPKATFSTCFGEPFLPLLPQIYAGLFSERIVKHDSHVWLINTGWTAGGYHTGYRMPLPYTRAMINWVLSGDGMKADYQADPIFGLYTPISIPGIAQEILVPRNTWDDAKEFDKAALALKMDLEENYSKLV
jgi:phosphoenolpyruvate carboxykinase (ATP)